MKIKKIVILVVFLLFSFLTISNVRTSVSENEESSISVNLDELNDKNLDMMYDAGRLRLFGGGGIANDNCGGMGAAAGGGGGFVLLLTYYLSQEAIKFFDSLKPSTGMAYTNNPTIDDVLSDNAIKKAMDEFKWDKDRIIYWLEKMLDTTCEKFLKDDDEIKVFLGTSDYELKYYNERNNSEHKYAFHTDDSNWNQLKTECSDLNYKPSWCSAENYEPFDRIWVINMIFLQMAILKNATFVLVTPTENYYTYSIHKPKTFPLPNNPGKEYTPFYGRELKYINDAGYEWYEYTIPNVETRK